MPRKKQHFRCPKCGQSFGMKMHLGRHLSAKHGMGRAKTARRAGRAGRAGRVGRLKRVAGRLGLQGFSLEQLIALIAAAKEEAGRRIAEFQEIMR